MMRDSDCSTVEPGQYPSGLCREIQKIREGIAKRFQKQLTESSLVQGVGHSPIAHGLLNVARAGKLYSPAQLASLADLRVRNLTGAVPGQIAYNLAIPYARAECEALQHTIKSFQSEFASVPQRLSGKYVPPIPFFFVSHFGEGK